MVDAGQYMYVIDCSLMVDAGQSVIDRSLMVDAGRSTTNGFDTTTC